MSAARRFIARTERPGAPGLGPQARRYRGAGGPAFRPQGGMRR